MAKFERHIRSKWRRFSRRAAEIESASRFADLLGEPRAI
jgi:hypothetical protein